MDLFWDSLCYGLPQSGRLANDLLRTRLKKEGYYKASKTPDLWRHKWRPIQFVLIVDDFGIIYVRKQHALHLLKILEQNYEITVNWEGKKSAGIYPAWNYDEQHAKITCRIYTNDYIDKFLMKCGNSQPNKSQLSPHTHWEVTYGAKEQLTPE